MRFYRELQMLACFVHGILTAGHALGLAYNLRKKNRFDVCCHSLALGYDLWALRKHIREVKRIDSRRKRHEKPSFDGVVRW